HRHQPGLLLGRMDEPREPLAVSLAERARVYFESGCARPGSLLRSPDLKILFDERPQQRISGRPAELPHLRLADDPALERDLTQFAREIVGKLVDHDYVGLQRRDPML